MAVEYGREVIVLTKLVIPQEGCRKRFSETAYKKSIFSLVTYPPPRFSRSF